ncbi:type I restriction endonuclease subunit R [Candidatus Poriferisodalis sp.]|uniref:type I restriction endonuclease subunit R n=1 Tax=Candidatus Poriferisodalis sp. TaxID=3101277 RepID=UPI003B025523
MTSLADIFVGEADVEEAALAWLADVGWQRANGPDIGPDAVSPERADYSAVLLDERLRDALAQLNPAVPLEALEDAVRKLTRPEGSTLEARNRAFHRMLVRGVQVEHRIDTGGTRGALVKVLDYGDPFANDLLAVSQVTVVAGEHRRRLDVVLFVNGLPLGIIELKSPTDEDATVWSAWQQLQTYKNELPALFSMNELLIVSDGNEARLGTLTAGKEWFKPWRTVTGDSLAAASEPNLRVLTEGVLAPERLLPLIRDFVVFEDDGSGALAKKLAGYHQFHAVRTAIGETLRATRAQTSADGGGAASNGSAKRRTGGEAGDRRIGVVWHTQGAGKSLTMAFYAGAIASEPEMNNPTIVVLTDRNDLDDQLFGTFSRCADLLGQPPTQAANRADLRNKLSVNAGGVVFTTIQKFLPDQQGDTHPTLSDRRNIVVIADEAHRSQYDFIDGFARHLRDALPNASFVGFTGTPIERQDANTRAVFGDYISVYDIRQAVDDGATVPIYYESRLAKVGLEATSHALIDEQFEEVTEGEEAESKELLKTRWAQLEAIVGADERVGLVAADLVEHFDQRVAAMEGKAMVVCMSRRICIDLYRELVRLRPDWASAEDSEGVIKVVMTGSASDPDDWQPHIRNKARRETLAKRFRDPDDELRIVLVRDMWLTGFDAPSLHTMYVDKPMRGHGLMQAIARVNRVFKDKPGGLVVDYLGLAAELKQALATYTDSGGKGETAIDQGKAVEVMLEKHDVCCGILHGFDWSSWTEGASQRLELLPAAQEHVLSQAEGKERFTRHVRELEQAFALAVPHRETVRLRDDVAFFQTLRSVMNKPSASETRAQEELDHAIRQIVSQAIAPEGVVDIFAAAGLSKPDISILSEEFLAEMRDLKHRNVAVDLLAKLLNGEVTTRRRTNVVQARLFSERLTESLRRYQNRAVEAAQVIEELIALAREMREADRRGEQLGLTDDEVAFYDALETNDSAVAVLGDETLRDIARELVHVVRNSVTIDWAVRESVRAEIRTYVKRILHKHGYPPDKQEAATRTVLEQAEVLSEIWANAA